MRRTELLVLAVAGAILVTSLLPAGSGGAGAAGLIGADKLLHAVGYGVLALVAFRATSPDTAWEYALVVLGVVAFGGAVELLQGQFPTRQPSLWDALANALGAVVASFLWWARERRQGGSVGSQ